MTNLDIVTGNCTILSKSDFVISTSLNANAEARIHRSLIALTSFGKYKSCWIVRSMKIKENPSGLLLIFSRVNAALLAYILFETV